MSKRQEDRGRSATKRPARAVGLVLAAGIAILPLLATRAAEAQTYRILHSFADNTVDGGGPTGDLVRDSKGNLYGTTAAGGALNAGTVFMISPTGVETVLYSFTGGTDGGHPCAGLIRDSVGNLYGTAYQGGSLCGQNPLGCGTVFKLASSGQFTVLHSFTGGTDGLSPYAGLVMGAPGILFGTTLYGGDEACFSGPGGCGTVFAVSSTTTKEKVLYSFTGGTDGQYPYGGLVRDTVGNSYGTTAGGGANGHGTVFKVSASGAETVLYSFAGGADGAQPQAGLIRDSAGNLYGTTYLGGVYNFGTVFEFSSSGVESVLYTFTNGTDDGNPFAGVTRDSAGNLYGTTQFNQGNVFELDSAGILTVLHTFNDDRKDGNTPQGSLDLGAAGGLYGTAVFGGAFNRGIVYQVIP